MKRTLATILLAGTAAAPAAAEQRDFHDYPAPLRAIMDEMRQSCTTTGGDPEFVPDAIFSMDASRDGIPDYFLSAQGFYCYRPGQRDAGGGFMENAYCTRQNCMNWLVVSQPRGRFRLAWSGRAFNAMPFEAGEVLGQTQQHCRMRSCELRLVWNGTTLVPDRRRRR